MTTNPTPADHATKPSERIRADAGSTLNDFHRVNFARQHEAFAPPHSLTALVVCVQEKVGELAAAVLGYTGEKKRKAHLTRDDVLDAVADAMTYLSLVASNVGCFNLEELLGRTFNMVSTRAGSKLTTGLGQPMQRESVRCLSSRGCAAWTENPSGLCTLHGPANPAASPSGEVAAPSPVAPICVRCDGPVEPERWVYALPTCYACLPPPPPIPLLTDADFPKQASQAESLDPELSAELKEFGALHDKLSARLVEHGIIRAAEGVTLEPGEYEVVEIDDIEPNLKPGDRARPERLACMRRLSSAYDNRYGWLFLDGGPSTWVTAVRRVPLTEPEPVPAEPRDDFQIIHTALHERDELRSKVSELEAANAELSRQNIDLFDEKEKQLQKARIYGEMACKWRRRCIDGGLAKEDERIEATEYQGLLAQVEQLRSTLTATEARLARAQEHITTLYNNARLFQDDFNLQVAAVAERDAELARVRGELATAWSDGYERAMNDRDNPRWAREAATKNPYAASPWPVKEQA